MRVDERTRLSRAEVPAAPRRSTGFRTHLLFAQVAALLLLAAPAGIAQETSPQGSAAPTSGAPVGADIETLRKLLGVAPAPPSTPEPAPEPEPPPAAPAAETAPAAAPEQAPAAVEAPAKAEPAPVVKAPSKSKAKPVARKPVPKKPSKAVVKKPAPAKPKKVEVAEPAKVEEEAAEEVAEPQTEEAASEADATEAARASLEDVPPVGTIIKAKDLDRWKHLLVPGQQWALSRGAAMKVVEAQTIPWEPARLEATERYHAQVKLSADKLRTENYVAGQPFPVVDPNDPDAGIKLMFNYEARVTIDDVDVRNFACTTGYLDPKMGFRVERDFRNPHFRRLSYVSRLYVPPMPTMQTREGIRSREMMDVSEPFDLKGAGFSTTRFIDTSRPDDAWLYFPQTKRLRRLSTAQRSEGVFGQDIDLDSYAGFSGAPAWSEWRFLGVKTVLASMHAQNMPVKWLPAPADFMFEDLWEPRDVYVLEGRSRLAGYGFSRRIIYIDRQSFLIPMNEIYDLNGNLWKSEIQAWRFGHKPRPEAVRAVYKDELGFLPGFVLFDMQFNHATRCELPARDAPNEEGWFYNFGEAEGTTEEKFLVSAFIGSGR